MRECEWILQAFTRRERAHSGQDGLRVPAKFTRYACGFDSWQAKRLKTGKFFSVLLSLTLFLIAGSVTPTASAQKEEDVRSAVIIAILRFTSWQEQEMANKDKLNICSFGAPLSGDAILYGINSVPSFGKRLSHKNLIAFEDHGSCDVLIVGAKSERVMDPEVLRNKLTVCDGCKINKNTVIANIELINKRITFDINLISAEQAGIKLSSDLLSHAHEVIRKPDNV